MSNLIAKKERGQLKWILCRQIEGKWPGVSYFVGERIQNSNEGGMEVDKRESTEK